MGSSAVTFLVQQAGGSVMATELAPWYIRAGVAAMGYVAYLEKMFWPRELAVLYPYPTTVFLWDVVADGALLAMITVVVIWLGRKRPYLPVGWFWYLGTLVPVIGFVQVGSQAMADRYAYVPLIGIFIMLVWSAAELGTRLRHGTWLLRFGSAAVIWGCMAETRHQVRYWKDSVTLLQHSLAICPGSALSEHNLGHALVLRGEYAEAVPHFEEALRLWPDYAVAHFNLANTLNLQGHLPEAIAHYRRALELDPAYFQAHYGLATTLALRGETAEAREHLVEALRLEPDYVDAHVKLGNLLVRQGELEAAVPHYVKAIQIQPDCLEAQVCLAGDLARQKRYDEAVLHYQAALKIKTNEPTLLNDLAWILATVENPKVYNPAQAVELAEQACESEHYQNPSHLDTLAVAYSEAGRFAEAIATTQRAVEVARSAGQAQVAAKIGERLKYYEQQQSYRVMMRSTAEGP